MTVTFCTIVLWVLFYLFDCIFDLMPLLSGSGVSVLQGDYYRMFTGVLLHGSLIHLAVNCAAMFWLGYDLEKALGRLRFALFSLTAVILTQAVYLLLLPEIDNVFGGSILTYTYVGLIAAQQLLCPHTPRFPGSMRYGIPILIYAVLGNVPLFSFMNLSTVFLHGIAFAAGFALTLLRFPPGSGTKS